MKAGVPAVVSLLLLAVRPCGAGGGAERVNLLPKLQAGQTFSYAIRQRSEKNVNTESPVVASAEPTMTQLGFGGLLRIQVVDVSLNGGRPVVHAKSHFQSLKKNDGAKKPDQESGNVREQKVGGEGDEVEFTILVDGGVEQVKGLDALSNEQQQAWREWISRFAMAWTLPPEGVKLRGKWKSEQIEPGASPIAGLNWESESAYVRDEPCKPMQMTAEGDVTPASVGDEICAVILTRAKLKQKSSAKDATPEDYKLRELRTYGTARGANETITYISLRTGMVVRATEEANQAMDVTVAKADGTNRVRYIVAAKSNSEVLLVRDASEDN